MWTFNILKVHNIIKENATKDVILISEKARNTKKILFIDNILYTVYTMVCLRKFKPY
jgi:hypothetical protein